MIMRDRLGADVRRNFTCNVLDGALFGLAMSLVSRTAVLPVFVKKIGGDNIAVGLIPVIWVLGFNLPQILVARRAQTLDRIKPFVLMTAVMQRLPWLLLAVLAWAVFSRVGTTAALILFFVTFSLAAVGGSINLPAWFELIAKITPVKLRGRLFGMRTVVGAGLGLAGGWLVEQVLEARGFLDGFALLAWLAFAATMASYVFLVLLHEPQSDGHGAAASRRAFLHRLPAILREHRNFRNFIIAEALLVAATTANAFFAVDAFSRFHLSDGYAGRFTAVGAGSVMVGSLAFGYVADWFGHKLTMLLSAGMLALACLVAIGAPSVLVYYVVFVAAAFSLSLRSISELAIVAELCRESERPTFMALKNAVTAPFVLLGLVGGFLANELGYQVLFWVAASISLASALWLAFMVKEPRLDPPSQNV